MDEKIAKQVEKDIIAVLLGSVYKKKLISENTYYSALNKLSVGIKPLARYNEVSQKEDLLHGHPES